MVLSQTNTQLFHGTNIELNLQCTDISEDSYQYVFRIIAKQSQSYILRAKYKPLTYAQIFIVENFHLILNNSACIIYGQVELLYRRMCMYISVIVCSKHTIGGDRKLKKMVILNIRRTHFKTIYQHPHWNNMCSFPYRYFHFIL